MRLFPSKKNVIKRWQVKTGSIDVVGVQADSPMEAATLVFEQLHEDSKIESENRLYNIGIIVECIDLDNVRQDPDNNTYYVLSSKVLANAGLHNLSRDAETIIQEIMDEEERS